MSYSQHHPISGRRAERGSAQVKLITFLVVLFAVGFAGSQYVPVAYNGSAFKQEMQTCVDQAAVSPAAKADSVAWTRKKIAEIAPSFGVPPQATLDVKKTGDVALSATVTYTYPVNVLPFGLYTYPYQFNYTATTAALLTK